MAAAAAHCAGPVQLGRFSGRQEAVARDCVAVGTARPCRQWRGAALRHSLQSGGGLSRRHRRARVIQRATMMAVDLEKVVPQADRVLLRLEVVGNKTVGGVLLPSTAAKFDRILVGEVISAGREAEGLSKGDKVIVSDVNAYEVSLDDSDAKTVFCRASDLLARVET